MQFCFMSGSVTLVMPVTPGSYQWTVGKRMETVNINKLGDVFLPGAPSRFAGNFDFLLPAQDQLWMEAGTRAEPQYYIDQFNAWALSDEPVRMVITETEINVRVYIEDVTVAEKDGTGDRYMTVAVREHCDLAATEVASVRASTQTGVSQTQNKGRSKEPQEAGGVHLIQDGETLSVICRTYYGKSSAEYYTALAKFNGIANPHLIYAGHTLQIPSESVLLGVSA